MFRGLAADCTLQAALECQTEVQRAASNKNNAKAAEARQ